MSDNIMNQSMFYNRSDKPAWHAYGVNDTAEHTAEGGLRRICEESGKPEPFEIIKQPLMVMMPGSDTYEPSGYYALVREPAPGHMLYETIGTPVSGDFESVGPLGIARLCDANILTADLQPVPVETLGILGKGERMFVTYRLPSYDVRGDEVAMYLFYDSPFTNGISHGGYTTGVRIVCQNTLNAALRNTVQQFTVTHTKGASELIAKWLGEMYQTSLVAAATLAEAYNILANKKVNKTQVKWIVEGTYPLPAEPREDSASARLPMEERLRSYEYWKNRTLAIRENVLNIYNGAGVGMDTPAVKGTAFGIYNAVSELETHARRHSANAVGSMINGSRANYIRSAFTLAMNADAYKTADARELVAVPVAVR